jgi:hypothetical protein
VKTLCTALSALLIACAALAGGAFAEENSLTLNESQRDDGRYAIDLTVSYVFPGQPPRTNNSGVGFVRVSLPGTDIAPDTTAPTDGPYMCFRESAGVVACNTEGQSTGEGSAFPTTMTMHLISTNCWDPDQAPSPGGADVWAAPNDPGTSPDVTLPINTGGCNGGSVQQPVLQDKSPKCTVPKLKGVPLVSATRRLANAKCKRGKVKYVKSKVKKNRVISQSVNPGKLLKEGTKVNLVVSRGS